MVLAAHALQAEAALSALQVPAVCLEEVGAVVSAPHVLQVFLQEVAVVSAAEAEGQPSGQEEVAAVAVEVSALQVEAVVPVEVAGAAAAAVSAAAADAGDIGPDWALFNKTAGQGIHDQADSVCGAVGLCLLTILNFRSLERIFFLESGRSAFALCEGIHAPSCFPLVAHFALHRSIY